MLYRHLLSGRLILYPDLSPEQSLCTAFIALRSISHELSPLSSFSLYSDGEGRGGNPLVSGFQDDLDPDDRVVAALPLPPAAAPSLDITLTSDEEEEEEVMKPSTAAAAHQDKKGPSTGGDLKG